MFISQIPLLQLKACKIFIKLEKRRNQTATLILCNKKKVNRKVSTLQTGFRVEAFPQQALF